MTQTLKQLVKEEVKAVLQEKSIQAHLQDRGIDLKNTSVVFDTENKKCWFFLYNLSGKLVGVQRYWPQGIKTTGGKLTPDNAKYFTTVSDEGNSKHIAVWGLESYRIDSPYLFVTEGIFDANTIHAAGYPAIAMLSNDPTKQTVYWLKTLPQTTIAICDNDIAGKSLGKACKLSFTVPEGKDMNDLSSEKAKEFLDDIVKNKLTEANSENMYFNGGFEQIRPLQEPRVQRYSNFEQWKVLALQMGAVIRDRIDDYKATLPDSTILGTFSKINQTGTLHLYA
jgi:hypothetical protein